MRVKISRAVYIVLISLIFLGGMIPPEIALVFEFFISLLFSTKKELDRKFVIVLAILCVHGVLGVLLGNNTLQLLTKQLFGISISYYAYYNLIYTVDKRFAIKVIKEFSLIVAMISIVQQIAFRINIKIIYDLSWIVKTNIGVNNHPFQSFSIFSEPSELALVLLPFASIGLYRLSGRRKHAIGRILDVKEAVIILFGFLCSLSSTGFIGLMVTAVYIIHEYKISSTKKIIILIGSILTVITAYFSIGGFRSRVDNMVAGLMQGRSFSSSGVNASTDTLLINLQVSFKALAQTFGLGGGLGSHQIFYERFVDPTIPFYGLNSADGNSLFIRLLSETGIMGIVTAFLFVFKNRVRKAGTGQVLSTACLAYIIIHLLRFGHYFNDGFWFVLGVYRFLHIQSRGICIDGKNINDYYLIQ